MGIEWQKMENPDLRKALGMKSTKNGVRIRRVEPTAPAFAQLRASDILMSFDGIDIANDGTGTDPLPNLTKSSQTRWAVVDTMFVRVTCDSGYCGWWAGKC